MQRITITLDDELIEAIDRLMAERGYQNRSEAIRDMTRAGITRTAEDAAERRDPLDPPEPAAEQTSVAALVYVYDHNARELSKRLTQSFHDHHDLTLATMHVHLDHDSCMEVAVLRGRMNEVRHIADHLIAERGVRHGRLVTVPVAVETQEHQHSGGSRRHDHIHVRHTG
ncbi:MAG TPA: nickel-responsive transcriptional regulator NikR [Stellaceae bacterium]|nr:nickel-responsive transcriptional regulator NikR [Stellaceae bacterium]